MRQWKSCLVVLGSVAVLVLVAFLPVVKMIWEVQVRKYQVTRQETVASAAMGLALLCQSDPIFFRDEPAFRPAWTPPVILQLSPTSVRVAPDGAAVELGGGFHHLGYLLRLDGSCMDEVDNHWILELYEEGAPSKVLTHLSLMKSAHIDRDDFIAMATAEFERRVALPIVRVKDIEERLAFLLKFDEVELARKSIRRLAASSHRDWLDQLLRYTIDFPTDEQASMRLDAWAQEMDAFSSWLLAAYAYSAAGAVDAAEQRVLTALTKPITDPEWFDYHARYLGAGVCAELLKAERYATCAQLAEALIDYQGAGTSWETELKDIRTAACRGLEGQPPADAPATIAGEEPFHPFRNIDMQRLIPADSE